MDGDDKIIAALYVRVNIDHERLSRYMIEHSREIRARAEAGNPLAMNINAGVARLLENETQENAEALAATVYYYRVAVEC